MSEPQQPAAAAKARVRAEVLAARRVMPVGVRRAADAAITAALASMVRSRSASLVTAYAPMAGEPGGPELPEALATALRPVGGRLLLPLLRDDNDLNWAEYSGPENLRTAGRGLREPVGPVLGVGAVAGADLIIVPAVAVDRAGLRLGRGGGSYDRTLARVPAGTLVVAPLYAGEAVAVLPAEPHDRPVGALIIAAADGLTATWRTLRP